ncbi:fimbrial protein [Xenorhabdus koppenhoeferi]|uniref:Pilin (Type 1 fimbria component protein) n=1 Tax=Xenorhabdus koppenhoeferi TaxID=351659 RepID=A0A1I7I5C3_9GAMM|nr:fimbrial protein [Xenorhabdus koppenhoeferi]SFU68107.1 Pilin (type 1 fimbria component protein) [Xenorhabdus koppenhoeferi]
MASSLKLLMASLFIVGMMSSFASQANNQCQYYPNMTAKMTPVSFGTIVIPRNYPIGTTIREIRLDQVDEQGYIAFCDQPTQASWDKPDFAEAHYNYDAIYESGVPGVGIRINTWGPGYGINWLPRKVANPHYCNLPEYFRKNGWLYCGKTWGYLTVQLIKIAPTTGSGNTHRRVLTRALLGNALINTFYLENTRIVTQGCSLKQNTIFVNMGDIRTSEFRGINSTAGTKDFELKLDCDANLNVQVLLDGRPAKSYSNNIWALDYSSDNVTAKGVGLQILYQNRLISIRTPVVSGSTQLGGYIRIPLSAHYIQTDARIIPGKANATATITLTYQ